MSKDSRVCVPGSPGVSFTAALVAASLATLLAGTPAAAANWATAGAVLANAPGVQDSLRAVTDGRGGFWAAWIDLRDTATVYVQGVDSAGVARLAANGANLRARADAGGGLALAPDGANGALVAWVDTGGGKRRIRVQHLDAAGASLWAADGVELAPTDSVQISPSLASDGAGGAIVAWTENRGATNGLDVWLQRVLANGTTTWGANGTALFSGANTQRAPRVIEDGAGGVFAAWEDLSAGVQTHFQRVNSSGVAQWSAPAGIVPATPRSESALMERRPASDTLEVAWLDTGSGPDDIWTGEITPGGALQGVVQTLPNISNLPVGLVPHADGTELLVRTGGGAIQAVPVSAAGVAGTSVSLATGQTITAASRLTVVPDGLGGLFVVWSSTGTARAQHVTSAGTADWGVDSPVALVTGVTSSQTYPVAVPGPDLLAAWIDDRNSGTTGDDLYMQRVSPSGVTGSYFRILATVGAGSGAFAENGGRTWVHPGDTLRVRYAGTSGQHVDHVVVGATSFAAVPNYTFHAIAGDSVLTAFFTNAAVTTQVAAVASSYRAFSVPSTFANPAVSSVFQNLMPYDPLRWRLGHWSASDNAYQEPGGNLTQVVPGAGYWFIGLKDTTLSFTGSAVAEATYNLPMLGASGSGQGWTQFGSPFRFPLAVSQLRITPGPDVPISDPSNTATDPSVWEWNPGTSSYNAVNLLLPGRAYWLWRQSATAVTLRFPFEWNPNATGGFAPAGLGSGDWAIDVSGRSGAGEAHLVLGAAAVAPGRWNRLSSHALPAGPGDGLTLVARLSDWGADNGDYLSSFRPDDAALAWDLVARLPAGPGEASLTFAFPNLPAGRDVVLSDPAEGWSRLVKPGDTVPLVLSGEPRRLKLEVLAGVPSPPDAPAATGLKAAGPNPFHGSTTLSFTLAHAGPLRWELYDVTGRRVGAGSRTLAAGEHVIPWDGRDASGRTVTPGLYLLRWQADGRSGSARLVRTP